jgi:hypothetical protein
MIPRYARDRERSWAVKTWTPWENLRVRVTELNLSPYAVETWRQVKGRWLYRVHRFGDAE